MERITNIDDIRRNYDGLFFDRDTMRFFASRICGHGIVRGGRYFITSEKACFNDPKRVYTVREVSWRKRDDGREVVTIESVEECKNRLTLAQCKAFINRALKNGGA
jgi:hypothetical protein